MNKIYLLTAVVLLSHQLFGQSAGPDADRLLEVKKGDNFSIRSTSSQFGKRTVLRDALRIVGIGAMSYEASRWVAPTAKSPRQEVKTSWPAPLGAGLVLFSNPLAGHRNKMPGFITVTCYDKNRVPVQVNVLRPDRRTLRKNGGVLFSGAVDHDGYIGIIYDGDPKNQDIVAGLVIDVVPAAGDRNVAIPLELETPAKKDFNPSLLLHGGRMMTSSSGISLPGYVPAGRSTVTEATKVLSLTPAIRPSTGLHGKDAVLPAEPRHPMGKNATSLSRPANTPAPGKAPIEPPFLNRVVWIRDKNDHRLIPEEEEGGDEPDPELSFIFSKLAIKGLKIVEDTMGDGYGDDDDDGGGDDDDGDDDDGDDDGGGGGGGGTGDDDEEIPYDPENPYCTNQLVDGSLSADDYQTCLCEEDPDLTACQTIDPPDPNNTLKCLACDITFSAAVAAAFATYNNVNIPACEAGAPTALEACEKRARATLEIQIGTAETACEVCLLAASCFS